MESVNLDYIFAQPDIVDKIPIYPIKLRDYNKFQEVANLLYISRNHFQETNYPLLALLFMSREQLGLTFEELIEKLVTLFSLIVRKEVRFISSNNVDGFLIDNDNIITVYNYDAIRQVIMKQNLIFEQKVYKNKLTQEWAEMILESRNKNAPKMTIEDMITTVKNFDGLTYEQVMEQSIYQLYADFFRIVNFKQFDQTCLFSTVSDKVTVQHFAAFIDLFKSPYDDLFVNKDKLKNVNTIFNQKEK